MAEVTPGAVAPEAPATPAPGAQPVTAPDAPTGQENAEGQQPDESVKPEKTYTEEELRAKVSERLSKERKRIAREVKLELERDHYKAQAERVVTPQTTASEAKGEPRASEFQTPEAYLKALVKFEREQAEAAREEQSKRERGTRDIEDRERRNAQFVQENIFKPGKAKHADFEETVLSDDAPVSDAMIAAAADMGEIGPEVLYRLCQDPAEVQRIAGLSDSRQLREMLAWESKVKANPTPTKTPPPIVPSSGKSTVDKDPQKMTDKEFNDWRKRQIAQRR